MYLVSQKSLTITVFLRLNSNKVNSWIFRDFFYIVKLKLYVIIALNVEFCELIMFLLVS